MKNRRSGHYLRSFAWFILAGFVLVSLGGASIVNPDFSYSGPGQAYFYDPTASRILGDLNRLGLLSRTPPKTVEDLLRYERLTGKSLAQILANPVWAARFGLASTPYKATWYIANPFQFLPPGLQKAIRNRDIPFQSRTHVWQWCKNHGVPEMWRKALYMALIETTPQNLWRAARGERPFTKSGRFLEPIVIDHGQGNMEARDGHIATDPRLIPTNTEVLLVVKIKGEDRILRVVAADVGEAIKGRHVDLPIHMALGAKHMPYTRLPHQDIRNPTVRILTPLPARPARVNRDRKA